MRKGVRPVRGDLVVRQLPTSIPLKLGNVQSHSHPCGGRGVGGAQAPLVRVEIVRRWSLDMIL